MSSAGCLASLVDALKPLERRRGVLRHPVGAAPAPIRQTLFRWPASSRTRATVRPRLDLVRDHRRDPRPVAAGRRSAGRRAVRQRLRDARSCACTSRRARSRRRLRSCIASISSLLELGVAFGLADEQEVAPLARGVERAPDQVAGERGGGDGVGDEADRVRRAGAKAPRDDVRPVAGLARRAAARASSTSAEIRISSRRPESTNEAAVCETPARRATSASVTRFAARVQGVPRPVRGSLTSLAS